jgi:hypothetical protein
VLLTFGAALAIETDLSKNVNTTVLGGSLVVVNILVLGLALGLGAWRHQREDRAEWGWRRGLNSEEFAVLQAVMTNQAAGGRNKSSSYGGGLGGFELGGVGGSIELSSGNPDTKSRLQEKSQLQKQKQEGQGKQQQKRKQRRRSQQEEDSATAAVLQQHLVQAKNVKLLKKVGAGAYGEVFKGSYSSSSTAKGAATHHHHSASSSVVAVKTMLRVTEVSARAFRREILLTATLRHPNIVRRRRAQTKKAEG